MGWLVVAATILLAVAAVVSFLSDVSHARQSYAARRFDRRYEANRARRFP
jgi:hypothetical protein